MGEGSPRSTGRWRAPVALLLLFGAVVALNPAGFIGAGADDTHYLSAARCWAEHGPCLPHDHWQARWPLVAPFGLMIALFGESRLSLGIVPLVAEITCLFGLAAIGNRLFGRPAGWLAAMLLAVIPAFALDALDPNVDVIELAFLILSACAIIANDGHQGNVRILLAGILAGLAFQTRETSLVGLPLLVALIAQFNREQWRRHLLLFAAGFGVPILAELIASGLLTGDPLWRRHLSLAHITIASSEIDQVMAPGTSPFFNLDLVRGWHHSSGIHVHWLLDGLLNLVADSRASFVLLLAPALLWLFRRELAPIERRTLIGLLLFSLLAALLLIFALAIDPKARMFMVSLATSCLVLGTLLARLWRSPARIMLLTATATAVLPGLVTIAVSLRPYVADRAARRWLQAYPSAIEVDPPARSALLLIPEIGSVPASGSGRPFRIMLSEHDCQELIRPGASSVARPVLVDSRPLSWFPSLYPGSAASLCLFRISS